MLRTAYALLFKYDDLKITETTFTENMIIGIYKLYLKNTYTCIL